MDVYTPELRAELALLVTANHILAHHGLADALGSVSLRSPTDGTTFFMTRASVAPAAVSTETDLAHYRVADAAPVIAGDRHSDTTVAAAAAGERFLHAALLARYPGVRAIVHSSARDVVVAGVSGVPVRPMHHLAGFLGSHVPVFDLAEVEKGDDDDGENGGNDESDGHARRKVHRHVVGHSEWSAKLLAKAFERKEERRERDRGEGEDMDVDARQIPACTVVLQRGLGFTTWGESIQEAVFRAYYTRDNVRVQIAATDHSVVSLGEVQTVPLTKDEIRESKTLIQASVFKAWQHWGRVVGANAVYRNDLLRIRDSDQAQRFWRRTEHNRMMPV